MADNKLNKEQAQEIITLIQSGIIRMPEVFEKLDNYGVKSEKLENFKTQFITQRYGIGFEEAMQVFVNETAKTNIKVIAPTKYDIFFSFSSSDKAEAIEHVRNLRKCGMSVFFSDDELNKSAGQDFVDKINDALKHADHFILHCTPNAMESPWVKKEYKLFYNFIHLHNEKRGFFILQGKGFNADLLPFELQSVQVTLLADIMKTLNLKLPEEEIIQKLTQENTNLQKKYSKIKEETTFVHQELAERDEELKIEQKQNYTLTAQIKLKEKEIEQKKQEIEQLKTQAQNPQETNQLKNKIIEKEEEVEELYGEIRKIKEEITFVNKRLSEVKNELTTERNQKYNLETKIEQKQKEIEQLKTQAQNPQETTQLKNKIIEKENEIRDLKTQIQKINDELILANKKLSDAKNEVVIERNQKYNLETKIEQKQKEIEIINNQKNELQTENKNLYSKITILENKIITLEKPAIVTNTQTTGKNYTETINGVSFEMIWVEGSDNFLFQDTKRIRLDGFYVGKHLVTQQLYQAVMGENPSHFKAPQKPVEKINWYKAIEVVEKISKITNKNYNLPSDAQWEYAAKGGKLSKGYQYAGSDNIDEVACYKNNSKEKGEKHADYGTHIVGRYKPNELGIYDMSGNVYEWCLDNYEDKILDQIPTNFSNPLWVENTLIDSNTIINKNRTKNDKFRIVLRGGSWINYDDWCGVSDRNGYNPTLDYNDLGFRLFSFVSAKSL